jgi:N-methylhydantoinase B
LAERYRGGEVGTVELIRRHGVILDWGTGELLPKTTEGFRAMLQRRTVPHWGNGSARG